MSPTEAAARTEQKKSKSADADVKRGEHTRRKPLSVGRSMSGRKRRKEEMKQRSIIADCIKRIDQTLKRIARDEEEIRRLKEETRAVLSRL
jgi:hypothetical protein